MHKQRLAVVIAAALGVVSTFLPWVTVSMFGFSVSASGISIWQGILALLLCAAAGTFAFLGDDRNAPIDAGNVKIVAGAGGGAFVIVLLAVLSSMGAAYGSLGIGIWLALIASLAIVAVPFVIKDSGEFSMPTKDSIKDEFNEIKDN